jgi:hypothetical protein
VALAAAARRHIDTYPSVAEDRDSEERRAKYFVQRLTNSLTGLTEVSAPQAAASLMGLSSMVSTTHTTFCFIKGAMYFQDTLRLEGDEIMYENNNDYLSYIMNDEITDVQDNDLHQDTTDNNVTDYIDQPEDDNDDSSNIFDIDIADNIDLPEDDPDDDNNDSNNEFDMDIAHLFDSVDDDNDDFSVDAIALDGATPAVTNLLIHGIIDQAGDMPMPPVRENYERATDEFVMVYTVNGERVPIEPYIHYRYRGQDPKMRCYAFIEYTCCIAIVKRPQQSEEQVSKNGGRPPNGCYLFDPAHPLYDFYYQKIRSKQSTPILASVKPPPYPGDMPEPCTRIWTITFNRFARYYLTAFCPWDINTGKVPYSFDFAGYSAFVRYMAEHPYFLFKARTFMMENTMRGLMQNRKKLVATQMYKSKMWIVEWAIALKDHNSMIWSVLVITMILLLMMRMIWR